MEKGPLFSYDSLLRTTAFIRMKALRISDCHLTVCVGFFLDKNAGPSVADTHPHRFSKRSRVVFWSCTPAGECLYAFQHI